MLKLLRHKKTQRYIYIGIAITVVAGFGVSGVLVSKDDKKTLSSLALLGKRKISTTEYLNSYRAVQHQIEWMYGDKAAEMRSRVNFKGEAWDRLLLLDYAKKENIRASDQDVVKWVTTQDAFKNKDKDKDKFDQKYYEMYIERALRMDPRDFEEEVRQMLTIQKIQEKLKSGLSLTDEKLKELYVEERSEKNLLYSIVPSDDFKDQVTVTDKDTAPLYDIVKDQLTAPEKVKLSYVTIPKDKAESLKAALDEADTPLADLVKKYGLTSKETSYFSKSDTVPDIGSVPELVTKAFLLPVGGESAWISHGEGSTKIRVVDKQAEHNMSRDEAKDDLKKMFTKQKGTELAVAKLKTIKEKMKDADFETVLKAEKLEVTPLEKYRKGMYPAGIYPSEALQTTVAALKEGEISEAFEIPKGAMIVKVTKVLGVDDKKFADEKEDFKKETASKKLSDAMNELLDKLRQDLHMNLEMMKEIFPSD